MARRTITLDDPKSWSFRQADNRNSQDRPVSRMPTTIHQDLLHHGLIKHPFVGKQETDCQWVGEACWIYRCSFPAVRFQAGDKVVLAFDGLDTHATIHLNGTKILETRDMFIPERVEVTRSIHSTKVNELTINFESTFLVGKKLVEQQPDHRWGCWNPADGDPTRLAVRKAQYHFGWDWGPTILTCGPWRPIHLEVYTSRIADLYFTTAVNKSLKSAEVVAMADTEGEADEVIFRISLDGKIVGTETVKVDDGHATAVFRNSNPKLWYPHTYGEQPLYTIQAELITSKTAMDSTCKRFGLRRAELVQRKLDDASGTTFFFEINNIPVFCGGSNWIPGEILGTMSPEKYKDWVQAVADGSQVMLRVWGGGLFEEQVLYDACDERGVLVWQDFMFACGNYPANNDFLDLVKREATANVKRLRHHPCIVLWAGNNEDYQYVEDEDLEYDPKNKNHDDWLKSTFPARYIYEKILVDITSAFVPGTHYHFGSPYGGKNTKDPSAGDIHQWGVWHGPIRYQDFDKAGGRFVSEFGMEGLPDIRTIESYLAGSEVERHPQSSTMDFHNKASGQEGILARYLAENIPFVMEPLEQYIYCTQLLQSECVSTAYKFWKRQWKGPGREYCAGALVWQANDCWPCTSWSVMDYYLRPKMAYYAIKRELKPITLGLKRVSYTVPADSSVHAGAKTIHKIQMWACNLSLKTQHVQVRVRTDELDTGGFANWDHLATTVRLQENRSTEIAEFEIPGVINKAMVGTADDCNSLEAKQQQTVVTAYLYDQTDTQVSRAVNWPKPLKYSHLPKPKHVSLKLRSDIFRLREFDATHVTVSVDVPVKSLMLEDLAQDLTHERSAVVFDDNGIDMIPFEPVDVGVKGIRLGEERRLKVRYLGI
ncbi:hypothetical protein MMC21_000801 [Puttea exsequens]|nr:hypothetical protein [Puttea exsequens]